MQEIRLDLRVRLDGRRQVRPGTLDRGPQRRIERADLTGTALASMLALTAPQPS